MKYYLTIKRNEVLLHATTWMNLENFVSDRSQTQRPHLCEMSGGGESVRMGSDFEWVQAFCVYMCVCVCVCVCV
jgi:hypothetical protein